MNFNFNFDTSENYAQNLDKTDALKNFRDQFFIEDEKTIYLDGNSLGRLPLKTKKLIAEITENQWGKELIGSWNKHWYEKPVELGNKIASLIGAASGEVVVSDNTSINLYKLAHAALKYNSGRSKIVSDIFNFPTDLYILQGLIKEFGPEYHLSLAKSNDKISIDLEDLKKKIDENTALVVLSLVAFKSSFLYNAAKITDWAHKKGALVLWDLSHAVGAVPVELNKTNAELAVGCTYKYLNGGPGSPAFLYVNKKWQDKLGSPVQGWFGDQRPFEFDLNYQPAEGIRRFLSGTPPVISLMATEPGLDILLDAGIENLREKSIRQSEYLLFLTNKILTDLGFKTGSPTDPEQRGSHISLKHPEAYRICQALIHPQKNAPKIIPDFREPDNIRFGITPLYTTFSELRKTIFRLKAIVTTKEFENFSAIRTTVT
ncbi:MAG: kynureninase [Bacteroidota bacterium]